MRRVVKVPEYKAKHDTALWTWAWSSGFPPQHIRVNLPIHTITVDRMLARWQQHPQVASASRREEKLPGGHYSMYNLDVRLRNNACFQCGVSTHQDPPYMQHVYLQFGSACGTGMEKRHAAANIMFELLDVVARRPVAANHRRHAGRWRQIIVPLPQRLAESLSGERCD